jgi:DNA-binding transcriptional regulator YiaG
MLTDAHGPSAYAFPFQGPQNLGRSLEKDEVNLTYWGSDKSLWAWTSDGVILLINRNESSSANVPDNSVEKTDVTSLSPSEQIAFVRETLSLNMSRVAELIGVTRPTAYAWLDGREKQGETAGKIMRLAIIIQSIKEKDIPRLDLLVKRPIFEGKSLLDLIKENKETTNFSRELDVLQDVGVREETTRRDKRISPEKLNVSRVIEAIDELAIPISFEEPLD